MSKSSRPKRDWAGWVANLPPPRLAAGDGSCARLVAVADWGVGGVQVMHRVGAELVHSADADTAVEAELFGLLVADGELLLRIEHQARSAAERWEMHRDWPRLVCERFDRTPAAPGPAVRALASLHPDGRLRERAVQAMAEPEAFADHAAGFTPFLVLRAADWAEPVREAARAALVDYLERRPDLLFRAAPPALRLADRHRSDFAIGLVRGTLANASQELFTGFLTHPRPELRRLAAEFPERIGSLGPDSLERLSASAYANTRVLALTALGRAGLVPKAREPLTDPDRTVRKAARAIAAQRGIDVAARYREMATAAKVRPGTLYELARTAEAATTAEIRSLIEARLSDPSARVRVAAIGALDSVGGLDRDRLAGLLHDPAGRVIRAAAHRLAPDAEQLDLAPLLAVIGDPERTETARRFVYDLVCPLSDEARFAAALTVLGSGASGAPAMRATEDLEFVRGIDRSQRRPWLRDNAAYAHYIDSYRLDGAIVPDMAERFATARPFLESGLCEAFEILLARGA